MTDFKLIWSAITGRPMSKEDEKRIEEIQKNSILNKDDAAMILVVAQDAHAVKLAQDVSQKDASAYFEKLSQSSVAEAKALIAKNFIKILLTLVFVILSLIGIGYLLGQSNDNLSKKYMPIIDKLESCDERNGFPVARVMINNEYKCVLLMGSNESYKDINGKNLTWQTK